MAIFKKIKRIAFLLFFILLSYAVWYAWQAFPIISGFGAKNLCAAFYLQHRNPQEVIKQEFSRFPLLLGSFTVNEKDSSVTGSVWGLAKKKAIYRKGIGCTLINGISEAAIRKQVFSKPVVPAMAMDSIAWPYGDKTNDIISTAINSTKLGAAVRAVFNEVYQDKAANTRAVLALYDGKIVKEQYAPGFDKHTVLLGWSMSKSLTSAMIGILVKEGKLEVDAPAPVPEWKDNEKKNITIKHLLQQCTGLDYKENYTGPSDVTNMLFKEGDMAAFTAKHSMKYPPGTVFNYTSGNSNILSRIIRQTVGENEYTAFPYTALFHKINAYSFLLEPDASGTYIGSSYSYGTARDFARFGLLYFNNGKWGNKQLLPQNWVQASTQPYNADKQKHYGYQWWLNGFDEANPSQHIFPGVPADMFYAGGFGGQIVAVIPSKKLVVVRLGLDEIDRNKFLKAVCEAIN